MLQDWTPPVSHAICKLLWLKHFLGSGNRERTKGDDQPNPCLLELMLHAGVHRWVPGYEGSSEKAHVSDRVSQAFCQLTNKLGIDICVTSKPVFAKGEHNLKSQKNKTSRYFTPGSCTNPWIFCLPSQLPVKRFLSCCFQRKCKVNNPKTLGYQQPV